jgi:hypothetical protein
MTSALDGGEWSVSHPGHTLALGKGPPVPIGQEAGWAPELVWTQRLEEKSFRLCRGSNPNRLVVQPEDRHYTDCANPAPTTCYIMSNFEKNYVTLIKASCKTVDILK